jgi:hypothetical protein
MGEMLSRASGIIESTDFTALYDKGYHNGSELKAGQEMKVGLMVAIPDVASNAPDKRYNMLNFKYDNQSDNYTCPENRVLKTNGKWYNKSRGHNRTDIKVKHYKTNACKTCLARGLCTINKKGRFIERSEYAEYVEQNRKNIEANKATYKRRQAIVEHPYGTIKRQWGFNYIITKRGMARASSDVGFMFTAYNLRRIINIIGFEAFMKHMEALVRLILRLIILLKHQITQNNSYKTIYYFTAVIFDHMIKRVRFDNNLIITGGY